jgi:hypothetical protein
LYRLQGQEAEALKVFEGCRDLCRKNGSKPGMGSAKSLGMPKKKRGYTMPLKDKDPKTPTLTAKYRFYWWLVFGPIEKAKEIISS